MKIAIIGYSGAGKSTLAKKLGKFYNIPVLHLDKIQFIENWQERNNKEALESIDQFMKNESWVIDGNYGKFRQELRLKEADTIIFLNFPRYISFYQAYKRYKNNINKVRDDMAKGCIEKFDWEFIKWILFDGRVSKYKTNYKNIEKLYPDKFIQFKNNHQVEDYLENLTTHS